MIIRCRSLFVALITTLVCTSSYALAASPSQTLLQAVMNGSADQVSQALAQGADINFQDDQGYTALMWSLMVGQGELTPQLIKAGAHVAIQTPPSSGSVTALILAATMKDPALTQHLLKASDIKQALDLQDNDGRTALICAVQYAAQAGSSDIVKLLIQAGAATTAQAKTLYNKTALLVALWTNAPSPEIVTELLKAKDIPDSINLQDDNTFTALMYAAQAKNTPIVQLLVKAGAATTPQTDAAHGSETVILQSVWTQQPSIPIIQALMEATDIGQSVNIPDKLKRTPLIYAVQMQNTAIVSLLIKAGASTTPHHTQEMALSSPFITVFLTETPSFPIFEQLVTAHDVKHTINLPDKNGDTPLMYALRSGNPQIVDLFIKAGAKTTLRTPEWRGGQTVLMMAVTITTFNPEILAQLLGAPDITETLNLQDTQGYTALALAALVGNEKAAAMLVDAGALSAPCLTVDRHPSALMIALMAQKISLPIVRSILKTPDIKESLNLQDTGGNSALMYAVIAGDIRCVKALLKAGARTTAQGVKTEGGQTALMMSIRTNKFSLAIVKALLAAADIAESINLQDAIGYTALMYSVQAVDANLVRLMLSAGAATTVQSDPSSDSYTALMLAIDIALPEKMMPIIKMLLKASDSKHSIDLQDVQGRTAAMIATYRQDYQTLKLLIDAGASSKPQTYQKKWTAIMYALQEKALPSTIVVLLRAHDIHGGINLQATDGSTALIMAVKMEDADILRTVTAPQDLDANIQDKSGMTALMYAAQENNLELLQILTNIADISFKVKNKKDENKMAINYATDTECKAFLMGKMKS